VKHAGRHGLDLPRGKDTTVMFGAGAAVAAGIDGEKTILTLNGTSLEAALDILSGHGIATAIVEGWKSIPWPKVVIGDLEAEEVLLRNPSPEEVIRNLDRFPDFVTLDGLLRELREICREKGQPCTTAAATLPLPVGIQEGSLDLPALVRSMEDLPGVAAARAAIRRGALFGAADEILVAVAAETGEEASSALQIGHLWCGDMLMGIDER
jgi:molybdopterin synthase catalytic subunit